MSVPAELSPRQVRFLARVVEQLDAAGIETPDAEDIAHDLRVPPQAVNEIIRIGVKKREIVAITAKNLYSPRGLSLIQARVRENAPEEGYDAASFRKSLATPRKYADALMSYFEEIGFFERSGPRLFVSNEFKPAIFVAEETD